jgi:hypothetical protein
MKGEALWMKEIFKWVTDNDENFKWDIMDWKILQVRHYGLYICASEALWMKKILGEALSRVEGLYKGIPHYLPFFIEWSAQIPLLLAFEY